METIIAACISAGVTLVVCMINNNSQQKKSAQQQELQQERIMDLLEYKMEELTKRVDKHNNLVERTYHLEEESILLQEKMRVANHRIEDLEKKGESS